MGKYCWVNTNANQYLAITGAGIDTIKIAKKAWIYPWQRCRKFDIQPRDYPLDLQAMTKEKLKFQLPIVFTIGPDINDRGGEQGDALAKYAMLLADSRDDNFIHVSNIVKGIIEGETRLLVGTMTMEEIFCGRDALKKNIQGHIKGELAQFGLKIYNANVKELEDAPGSSYFASQSKKAHEGAINQARIDVADAMRLGNVGEAQRLGEQDREIAKIHAETAVQRTERDSERAEAEAVLAKRRTGFSRDVDITKIEANRATEVRDEELKKDVEIKRCHTELERLRAVDVVKATIDREAKQQSADAKNYEEQARANAALYSEQKTTDAAAYKLRINAEANVFAQQKNAEVSVFAVQKKAEGNFYAQQKQAEANFFAAAKEAEADLVRQQKQAAGLSAMAGAYSDLSHAFGGSAGLIQYLMIEKGVYTDLAKANAEAVRGLNPKMTIWNTGSQAGGKGGEGSNQGGIDSIRNMYQMLPPLMSTINEQTGITLPEWQFGKLGEKINDRETNGTEISGLN